MENVQSYPVTLEAPISRGIKRVRQACNNCRRKKTRCPGERPICSFCQRLSQHCEYDDDLSFEATAPTYSYNPADMGSLVARISELESKLNDMSRPPQANISAGTENLQFPDFEHFVSGQQVSYSSLSLGSTGSKTGGSQGESPPFNFDFVPAISIGDLPKVTFDRLINDYFRYSHNQPYSFFHETTFRQNLSNGNVPDFLLEVVVMSALRFSHDQYFDSDIFFTNKRKATADTFGRSAWKHISSRYIDGEDECSVSVVQAITLLAIYEFIEGRQRGAWVKIGIAAKFAQDLRLMFEPSASLPFSEQEESRRAFWSIYLLDQLMTCGRARPPVFADPSISMQLPCSERSFKINQWEQAGELEAYISDRVVQTPRPSPFARVVIISALLSRISQYAIQAQREDKNVPPWDTKSQYTSTNASLLYLESHPDWEQSVTDLMAASMSENALDANSNELLIVSQALYHLSYCILNHYFLLRQKQFQSCTRFPHSFYFNALQVGLHHAQEFTKIIRTAVSTGCMVVSSFLSYACLVTATVHAVYRHSEIAPVREQASMDLDFSLSFLQRQAQYWPNAATILNQLTDFCHHSLAYKELISVMPEVTNVSQEDANRLYVLIDYSTLSNTKEVAVWPQSTAAHVT